MPNTTPEQIAEFIEVWEKSGGAERSNYVLFLTQRFGFITTNSIHQTFNRRVIEPFLSDAKKPLHLAYAIPDHPWIDSADGAAVRIAMTVAAPGHAKGVIEKVIDEEAREEGEVGVTLSSASGLLSSNLQIGADLGSAMALTCNERIAGMGVALHGSGFILEPEPAEKIRRQGSSVVVPFVSGADLMKDCRERYLIDFSFQTEEQARIANPAAYQHVLNHVKPERDQNRRDVLKRLWWRFGWERPVLRKAFSGLPRYIGTPETAKHRVFQFIPSAVLPEHRILAVASSDAFDLAVLGSSIHVCWALAIGGRLEDRPVYNKTRCFDPFPFPALEESPLKHRIRDLGERLDAHRKRQQEQHPDLTLTGMYNVLEKLRTGEALTAKDKTTHDNGLVTLLKQLHDDLDAAVLEAYGWTDLATAIPFADRLTAGGPEAEALEQQLLVRLVALNHERAAEEKRGLIRYLRPDYQAPGAATPQQSEIALPDDDEASSLETENLKLATQDWPADLPAQVAAVRKLLPAVGQDPDTLAACFGRKSAKRTAQIAAILATLRALGLIT